MAGWEWLHGVLLIGYIALAGYAVRLTVVHHKR